MAVGQACYAECSKMCSASCFAQSAPVEEGPENVPQLEHQAVAELSSMLTALKRRNKR